MRLPLPDLYIIDSTGNEQKVEFSRLRFEFQNGNKTTLDITEHNKDNIQEIMLRGYYGDKECEPAERYIVLNIRPGACNIIHVTPEAHNTKTGCKE